MDKHTAYDLAQMQSLPLELKIRMTENRIRQWYEHYEGDVYVSFSGGKDSTVLLDICRKLYPSMEAVFSDTGLEYPEIREFVRTFDNVTWVRPKMNFKEVIQKVGYPVASKKTARMIQDCQNPTPRNEATRNLYLTGIKRDGTISKSFKIAKRWIPLIESKYKISGKCCDIMKKEPLKEYKKKTKNQPIVGTMASESTQRKQVWVRNGCNAFSAKNPISTPMSFWTERDVLQYLKEKQLPYASVYGDIIETHEGLTTSGVKRTGCMFCMFGCQLEKEPNRFQQMKVTHPKQWAYCMKPFEDGGLGMAELLEFIGVPYGAEDNQMKMWEEAI